MFKKITEYFKKKVIYQEDELLVKEVVEAMVNHADTKYRVAPISTDLVLKNTTVGYWMVISGAKIKVTNHVFSLEKTFALTFVEDMKDIIFKKMEAERQEMIAEIFASEKKILSGMLEKLSII